MSEIKCKRDEYVLCNMYGEPVAIFFFNLFFFITVCNLSFSAKLPFRDTKKLCFYDIPGYDML